jgi:hypothetical protein
MAKNIADEGQVQRDKRRASRADARRADALRAVMDSASGRLYLRSLIQDCGVFSGGFNPNSSNLYYSEGMRNVGLALLAECERTAPKLFRLMEDEAAIRQAADARASEPQEQADGG